MPELAEVEYYRKQWTDGLKHKILAVRLHAAKRVFRGTDTKVMEKTLTGSKLLRSETHGKQMLFQFSGGAWMGLHLGMTGKLRVEGKGFTPAKHDHLVLQQSRQALVFSDPRQFGRVLFHLGVDKPDWWRNLPPRIGAEEFSFARFHTFLRRHGKAPIKAVLLLQNGFPGVGNWMADEILWQAKIQPTLRAGSLEGAALKTLFRKILFVCDEALKSIGEDFSDPPESWLFRHRWKKKAHCPRCKTVLSHSTIGGRTTCWCPECQGEF